MLSKQSLEEMCIKNKLVENFINMKDQIQPNGIDFTLAKVEKIIGKATIDFDNSKREISKTEEIKFDEFVDLEKGIYKVTFNEITNMPLNIGSIAKTRSSLMRSGVLIHTSVWDAGYSGKGHGMMEVQNPEGIRLYKNAKIIQMVFFELDKQTIEGYNGIYQKENLV